MCIRDRTKSRQIELRQAAQSEVLKQFIDITRSKNFDVDRDIQIDKLLKQNLQLREKLKKKNILLTIQIERQQNRIAKTTDQPSYGGQNQIAILR